MRARSSAPGSPPRSGRRATRTGRGQARPRLPWGSAVPQGAAANAEVFPIRLDRNRVGREGLELHRVRANVLGRADELDGLLVALAVVCGDLRDHIDRVA